MRIITLSLLILLSPIIYAADYKKVFVSPDNKCSIKYEGATYRGEGSFYDITDKKLTIYNGYLRYGPIINWVSNYIAEVKIPTGSPNYHSYFYNCRSQSLSPRFNLAIAVNSSGTILATLEQGFVNFHHIDSEEAFYRVETPNTGIAEYFIFCESRAHFETDTLFKLHMSCKKLEDQNYSIHVPNQAPQP